MEKSEPTLVPQWLRSSGSATGGGTAILPVASSSSSHSDEHVSSKVARNNSVHNKNDHSLGRSSVFGTATSSYFRRSSSNSSANSRAPNNFVRNQRDKDYEFHDKDESIFSDHRDREYSDPLENITRRKEGLRRSQSVIYEGRGEMWSRKVVADLKGADKNGKFDSNGLLAKSDRHKASFERSFPSLGENAKSEAEIGRVPSPAMSSAIQSLPVSAAPMIGWDKWKSALAEVPSIVGNNGTNMSSGKATATRTSVSVSTSRHTGLNMAETVAQGHACSPVTPQLFTETQRLEELAIKQSRQLIPVTPSVPKALVLNLSDKSKTKVQQQQHPISSSNTAYFSPQCGTVKPDLSRASGVGRLHVLKPTWERNGVSSAAKDGLSSANGSKAANSIAAAPLVAGSPSLKSSAHISGHLTTERKPVYPLLEKRPIAQAQSRNDFFNLVRKKSVANSFVGDVAPVGSQSAQDKPEKTEVTSATQQSGCVVLSGNCSREPTPENKGDRACNGSVCCGKECLQNRKSNSSFDSNSFSEEEEAAFLRSMGWEENADEGGLTEEEINAFYRDVTKYINSTPSRKTLQGMHPRLLSLGCITGVSSGLNSSDSELES